ncbi:LacI family DNA-binding transcriptional regulator [Pararhizobium sp.]|uniref:LacI family DNA-binding transcriptional regulator n=1 Tax=Pararhizobium sp. TaxID=1977563 RepID=UPI0027182637|nr:LacI family DNA-binding transcriptional regulator [Pararhizobium sp.]MDO9415204.1 LacI family DNA-binding transcriptional regulator [Pararhizobium sp.]
MAGSDDTAKRKRGQKGPRENVARRVTMTDVAKAAGCSQATVSFVLNQTTGIKISDETRQRVIEAARALGYAAPIFAHEPVVPSLPTGGLIGFVVDQLATSPESATAIDGARQASWDAGTVVLAAQTLSNAGMEARTIEAMTRSGVSGLIYMTIFTRKIIVPPALARLNIPVVLLNCYTDDHAFPSVVPGEAAGAQGATQHLIDQGHRRIAMIVGEPWMEAAQDRLKGYRRALAGAGIGFDQGLVVQGNWSATSGYTATLALLQRTERPTAIYCQSDRMASGCYEALKEAGLSVPGDISVIGFDDDELARHLRPPLSTSLLPHRAMGAWAVEQLETMKAEPAKRYPVTRLECGFIERESVRRVPE